VNRSSSSSSALGREASINDRARPGVSNRTDDGTAAFEKVLTRSNTSKIVDLGFSNVVVSTQATMLLPTAGHDDDDGNRNEASSIVNGRHSSATATVPLGPATEHHRHGVPTNQQSTLTDPHSPIAGVVILPKGQKTSLAEHRRRESANEQAHVGQSAAPRTQKLATTVDNRGQVDGVGDGHYHPYARGRPNSVYFSQLVPPNPERSHDDDDEKLPREQIHPNEQTGAGDDNYADNCEVRTRARHSSENGH
jgi:hypothetical protein